MSPLTFKTARGRRLVQQQAPSTLHIAPAWAWLPLRPLRRLFDRTVLIGPGKNPA